MEPNVFAILGGLFAALFLYSMGAIAGFAFACSEKGQPWTMLARAVWEALKESPEEPRPRHSPLYLVKRAGR